jgi:pimeloyl-ACP methyl ester carboxylesterase
MSPRRTRALGAWAVLWGACAGCITPEAHRKDPPTLAQKEAATDTYVEVSGAWLRIRDFPARRMVEGEDRTPVLMVHGYGSRLESWAAVQGPLAAVRRVVSFDQRGFGMSERPRGAYGVDAHANDLLKLMDLLGLQKAVLVGHSYGGGVVLRAALKAPQRVSAVVLVDAFAMDRQVPAAFRWAKVPGLGEFIFATQFKEVVGEKYVMAFHDRQRFASSEAIDEFRGNMLKPGALYTSLEVVRGMDYAPVEEKYRTLRMPITLIWGEDDRVTPLSAGQDLAALVDSDDMVVLNRCGHVPLWERPQATLSVLQRVVRDVDEGRTLRRSRLPGSGGGQVTP